MTTKTRVTETVMVTTVAQAFDVLKSNLEITGLQASTVSSRQQNIREVVQAELTVEASFLAGSYARNTMIAPLKEADIDIFVVLTPSYFHHYNNGQNGGQAGLLDLVKRALKRTYARTPDISRNGQAVTVRFDDFVVDVVPCFNRQGGGYLIPNSISKLWISTDPKKHVEISSDMNSRQSGQFVPLIKMIKAWNKTHGTFFRSFHLEVLALAILREVTISDYPSGVRFYFDRARSLITQRNPDPAGYGDDIGSYLNTSERIQDAVKRFELAYDRAAKAEDWAKRGYIKTSLETWAMIFEGYFPAYG